MDRLVDRWNKSDKLQFIIIIEGPLLSYIYIVWEIKQGKVHLNAKNANVKDIL